MSKSKILNKAGRVFVVSAPSGGGKTSLTRAAVERLNRQGHAAAISVSYTTRAPRPGEQNGVHYHFVSAAQFEAMIASGEFLEHAQVFGQGYGTGIKATEKLLAAGTDVILDIDWQGGRQVRAKLRDAVTIFILPPSREELERRLRGRGQDSDAVIAGRMAQARDEMSHYGEYQHLIVNQDFEQALTELLAIFTSLRDSPPAPHARYKPLIQKLLA